MADNGQQLPLDWEELVNEGIEARKMGDQSNWRLGDLAVQVKKGYGQSDLEKYAARIGEAYSTLQDYHWVSKRYQNLARARFSALSWAHFRVVAKRGDAEQLLAKALGPPIWTVEQLRDAIKVREPVPPLPKGVYDVILADPPWPYDNQIESWGPTSLHYDSLPLADICSVDVPSADNSVLFLWVTNPFVRDAFEVMDAWGFEYKTNIVWVKRNLTRPGSGFYVRGRHELLFICTKGSMVPSQVGQEPIGSVLEADVGEHSIKPDEAYTLIERLYPEGRYLELFARRHRSGWKAWGDDSALLLAGTPANR